MIVGILTGTTASGKSALALEWAEKNGGEIISADSRQIYRGFRIGTGQPTQEEQKRVVHHLVDHLSPEKGYSAGDFLRDVQELEKSSPNRPRLVVGGTGFYLTALLRGLPPIPPIDPDLRNAVQQEWDEKGGKALYQELQKSDPQAAGLLIATDRRKICRALEVIRTTGKQWSWWNQQRKPFDPHLPTVAWIPSPEENRKAIATRVGAMLKAGWAEEVKELLRRGVEPTAPAFNSLGYPQILSHFNGEMKKSEVEEKIIVITAQYAKRQRTFFRGQLPRAAALEKIDYLSLRAHLRS